MSRELKATDNLTPRRGSGRQWYFAYGSNMDPSRFTARVGGWSDRVAARLHEFALRFSSDVESEGGGGAIVVPHPGGIVHGVAYLIDAGQMLEMDRVEFDPLRDILRRGRRVEGVADTERGPISVQLFTIEPLGSWRAPSAAYLDHIVAGLRSVGHPATAEAEVRRIARDGE